VTNKKTKTLAFLLIGAGLLILGGLALAFLPKLGSEASSAYQSAIPVEVDYPAPQVNLTDLQGNSVSLEGLRGQWVLINHWAFWCTPCRDELPILEKYYKDHQDKNFTIVAIESGGDYDDVAYHAKLYRLSFPVWQDPQGIAASEFFVGAFPTSFMINPDGQVVLAWAGPISRDVLDQYITPLLEE
jgi:thiol-disulfide isomerase/thioredoxin